MTREIFGFEIKYQMKQPLLWVLLVAFATLTFIAVTTDGVTIGGSIGNVNRNAPFVIMQFLLVFSIFGVLTSTAFAAGSIHRDFELGTDSLFFSSPIRKAQYLFGRFFGSFAVGTLVYAGVIAAIMIGSYMPWIDKARVGPFLLTPYLYSFFVLIVPNLFLSAAIFFAVAALTRSMFATYMGVVGFFVGYAIAGSYLGDLENEKLASLLDPFGFGAFEIGTRFWTVWDRNHRVLPLEGVFLWNRILWISVGLVVLAFAFWKFEMKTGLRTSAKKKKVEMNDDSAVISRTALALPSVRQSFGGSSTFSQFINIARLETRTVLKSIPFVIMILFSVLNTIGNAGTDDRLFGVKTYPVTHAMVEAIQGGFLLFAVIIAAFFAADIVWRERTVKLNEVHDAMPVPTFVLWAAKLFALLTVIVLTLTVSVLTTIGVQIFKHFTFIEPGLYARSMVWIGISLLLITVLAFLAQAVTNNRYIGFTVMLVFFLSMRALPALHFEHHLYRPFTRVNTTYSDMNGFGHFVAPIVWFSLYWLMFGGMMLLAAHLFWVRGTASSKLQRAKVRFNPKLKGVAAALLIGATATGCYIFYNTNVLNEYVTTDKREKAAADYEKKYKKYERIARPLINDVTASVDIFPESRGLDVRGNYVMENRTGASLSDLHVTYNPRLTSMKITIPGAKVVSDDPDNGYTIYRLDPPLAPGAKIDMQFVSTVRAHGFENESSNNQIVANGTFINNFEYFPHLGYVSQFEIQEPNRRRKHGLPPVERMPKRDDKAAQMHNEISSESDWINLDTTVSTSADQIALAPGYLQKDWTQNGRRYFHYKTTSPILGFWSYLSARYTVKRDKWNDVPIEIYYDAKHPYNVDRMIDGVKKSLDYYTKNFSPYQHKQVRILEFPRYARFAQSFPNTIPFSESIGFIADLRDKDTIDYVFYVTAHEMGHQWWAHQVIGAGVQGSTMITETLSQYSALMVMEKEYGKDQMRRFLRYELNRYLGGRGGELVAEMPVALVEGQSYIHYSKGSLAMYALRDTIGEDKVNAALASFIRKWGLKGAPYPTTRDLIAEIRAVATPDQQPLITDLLESIILFDNKATETKAVKMADGRYKVTVTVESTKLRSDGAGNEKPIALNDMIEVGVFEAAPKSKDARALGKALAMEKKRITGKTATFEFIVSGKPAKAGIDPMNKLIDRNPDDNTKSVDL
jgi:ABC-2 type transport system permease protein